MSALTAAKTILEADGTLTTAATGGIYDLGETGPEGINRTTVPGAFDSNGIIKPCVLLKLRSSRPDGVLRDNEGQYSSVQEMLESWFYQDSGYSTIETMRDRVYALLHTKQLSGTFQCLWAGDVRGARDTAIDANVERSDYQIFTKKSV